MRNPKRPNIRSMKAAAGVYERSMTRRSCETVTDW